MTDKKRFVAQVGGFVFDTITGKKIGYEFSYIRSHTTADKLNAIVSPLYERIAELETENDLLKLQTTAAQADFNLSEQHVQLLQRENDEMAQELGAIEESQDD